MDAHKNMIAVILIAILITVICHYTNKSGLTFPLTFVGIGLWIYLTPFKIENND